MAVADQAGNDATNDSGRVLIGLQQQGGDQGAGGGLAVASGHSDRRLLFDQSRQKIRAMPDLEALLTSPLQLLQGAILVLM